MSFEKSQIVAATRLFSSGVLSNLAKNGKLDQCSELFSKTDIKFDRASAMTIGDAFDAAFDLLKTTGARSEYIYKAALTHNVLLGVHSLSTASMVSEFRTGSSKADVAIFNGTSTVYEIKSERDNLGRLAGQIDDYRTVFARVYVICALAHADSVMEIAPSDVGVLTLARWNRISTLREATDRTSQISPRSVLSSLTNAEAKTILRLCGAEIPSVPNTRLRRELGIEFEKLDPSEVHRAMVTTLKKSRSTLSLKSVLHKFPKSVMPAVMSLRLKQVERERLIEVLGRPLSSL